jgi:hypothetical protein
MAQKGGPAVGDRPFQEPTRNPQNPLSLPRVLMHGSFGGACGSREECQEGRAKGSAEG